MTTLVLLESANGRLLDPSLRLAAAARRLSGDVHAAVIGRPGEPLAEAAARIDGLARLLILPCAEPDQLVFDAVAGSLASVAAGYQVILAADAGRGRSVLPLLAAKLRLAPLTSVSAIRDDGTFERLIHAGAVVERLRFDAPLRLLTLRATAFPCAGTSDTPCPIELLAPPPQTGVVAITGHTSPADDRPRLETARLVLGGGRGLGSQDAFARLSAIADRLGAAVGASRVAVDMGWAPHEQQIGQTGRHIAPALYVALGVSGAAQHLSGIREAERVVAINRDPEAPIFHHADLGLVGDAPRILAELEQILAGTE